MPDRLKKLYLSLIIVLSSVVAIFLWKHINLPIDKNLTGFEGLGEKNYHVHNDTLRFFLFICISLIPFFIFYLNFFNKEVLKLHEIFFLKLVNKKDKTLNLSLFLLILLIIFNFLIFDFKSLISEIDIFHEGLWLTPSSNYTYTNLFWSSSFIERGLGGNYFPLIIWNLTKEMSIGSVRFISLCILMGNKILVVLLAEKISRNIELNNIYKIIFFILLSVIFLSFISYNDTPHIGRRFFVFLLFLNTFYNSLGLSNKFSFNNYFLGFFSFIGILWFLDIGIYINILIIIFLYFLFLRKELKSIFSILIGVITGWILFYNLVSIEEFYAFIDNTYNIAKLIEQVGSIKYQLPFFEQNSRATKILIFFIIAGIFVINISFNKRSKFFNNNKIFIITLYIMSLITFKYALGRSDDPHIKAASGMVLLIISVMCVYYFIHYLQIFQEKFISKKIFKIVSYISIFLLMFSNFEIYKFINISKSYSNLKQLYSAEDAKYINNEFLEYNSLIKYYNKISKDDGCIQIFTDETALPYLMKKKSCTKYYVMMTSSPKNVQLNFIDELDRKKPKIILYKSEMFEFEAISSRLKLVDNFINKNYVFYEKYKYWTFLKLKN